MDIGNPRISQPISGKWDLKEMVGKGKHGIVYRAADENGNMAAVKIISLPNDEIRETARDAYGDDEEKLENFVGEIAQKFGVEVETMRLLGNRTDNIVKLYDHEAVQTGINWDIVIVMEFADTFKSYYSKRVLKVEDVINFGCDIARGLIECEKEKIIHRDIKEDNLFVGRYRGEGKLGDFGVSTISTANKGSTVGIGTPYYMAPEVAAGGEYTFNADIYSLGIVLYKMMNKTFFPFVDPHKANIQEAYDRRKNGEPLPLPMYATGELEQLGNIILKCCKYNPSERYRSAAELYTDLSAIKNRIDPGTLSKALPYMYKGGIGDNYEFVEENRKLTDDNNRKGTDSTVGIFPGGGGTSGKDSIGGEKTFKDRMMDTVSLIQSIINKDGRNSTIARGFSEMLLALDKGKSQANAQKHIKKKYRKMIMGISAGILVLATAITMLYPKTAVFYNDESDGDRIHVKYLFFPDRRFGERSANYLAVDGWNLYYSDPNEDHALYRQSIWGGDAELLCDADCEYDIVVGDYVYFTSYDEDEILCRIKKDGTGEKETVIDHACRDLIKNGETGLLFYVVETNQLMDIDTTTIK